MNQRKNQHDGKVIASNRKAFHDYEIDERFEAGLQLTGSEVKVLRAGKCTLTGAHVRVVSGEAWVFGLTIPEYPWSHQFNHEPARQRKLLLHGKEIFKIEERLKSKGSAAVILKLYFKGSLIKAEVGLGTGKKLYDKRHDLKEKDDKREIARATRRLA
ncbi:MAG: SsrA-binding protein SmpB [Myxococcota bacterium]